MPTITLEITDDVKECLDRELASGHFKDANELVQKLLMAGIRSKWKDDVENKIDEALADVERGDVVPWKKGDCAKLGREYLHDKRPREARL